MNEPVLVTAPKVIDEKALTIIELEERFELTAAAQDTDRCSNNHVEATVS